MKKHLLLAAIICCTSSITLADKDKKKDKSPTATAALADAKKSDKKTMKDAIKGNNVSLGLFTMYQDTTTGSMQIFIKKGQINKEFIYFSYSENGSSLTGQIKGGFRGSSIFSIRKYFGRLEFVTENTNYYFDPSNPISKAKDANISNAILSSQAIIAEDSTGYLIKADDLFFTENLQAIKPNNKPNDFFNLGVINKEKSKYISLKNYPANTDVQVEYAFDNNSGFAGSNDLADRRFATIRIQHSLIEVPQNGFEPRADDGRIGYFSEQVEDMTATDATPFADLIHRWHLVKKDPNAALSEPIEPLVFWIENTTPLEFRETIKLAGEAWNVAFEKAGFKNAVVMKIQADTSTLDAGDIRYNVLRWVSSPSPAYGGYGPSFVNPRTGEIMGADIMLEYIFVTNRLKQQDLYTNGLPNIQAETEAGQYCDAGLQLHYQNNLATTALTLANASEIDIKTYIKESLYYLVLHEMGHTLGLNHNMKATQLYTPTELNNKAVTQKTGLTGSVMDYPAVNIIADKAKQGQYFTTTPGPYDMWAIEYGYSPSSKNGTEEAVRLSKIASRSGEKALAFGNDADDMRALGRGIDPRVMVNDMSSDAITFGTERIKLVNTLYPKLKEKYLKNNESYQELRNAYNILNGDVYNNLTVISRYVGGVYVNRTYTGNENAAATNPYTPVPMVDQKRAMAALTENLFAPKAFDAPNSVYPFLQAQRRGFNFFGANEDPHIHDRVLSTQRDVLMHLIQPNTLKRLEDTKLYGNEYTPVAMLTDLSKGIFEADKASAINTFRQNIQLDYTKRLISIITEGEKWGYDNVAQSAALAQLNYVKSLTAAAIIVDAETTAHRAHIKLLIEKALSTK